MKGDFSRWTFDPTKHYSRVLSLQGRVFLDADFNEGLEVQLYHLRKLAADLLGPHAGPGNGFELVETTPASNDFFITQGAYYVNGILCESPAPPAPAPGQPADLGVRYSSQPNLQTVPKLDPGTYVAYLDVWERFVTYIEDEDRLAEIQQSIREFALGGPDTAARSKVVWQLRLLSSDDAGQFTNDDSSLADFMGELQNTIRAAGSYGKLKARARKPKADDLPCATNAESRFRGPENQLYRVEIHDPGNIPLGDGSKPTFKWSRENGSVVFPIRSIEGSSVTVETLGRDERLGLKPGNLVEIVDDDYVLLNSHEPILTVKSVDPETFLVKLDSAPASTVGSVAAKHPILRRWEGFGDVELNPDPDLGGYLPLEDGVEVRFSDGEYQTSDYWIIPARTATGDVEWPGPVDGPLEIAPHGVVHAYAPLAVISVAAGGAVTVSSRLRRTINQLWS
jgi:Family of unknown function (DUF6519)